MTARCIAVLELGERVADRLVDGGDAGQALLEIHQAPLRSRQRALRWPAVPT